MKTITIAGGGLSGLALGCSLRRSGVPVILHEAGTLPRHRVCGEFICGRGAESLRRMGLEGSLEDALQHTRVAWFHRNRQVFGARLPSPAFGLSRLRLDDRLARTFQSSGGDFRGNSRLAGTESRESEGTVLASGREPTRSDWLGLKLHCTQLQTEADLELHLGEHAYLGLSGIEAGRTNVCGLFRRRPGLSATRGELLVTYLKACGLASLAERIENGGVDPGSHAAVAGVVFSAIPEQDARLRLGDAYSAMPPFTGNGMSLALESAERASPLLTRYAKGEAGWSETVATLHTEFSQHFGPRLRAAGRLHPLISHPAGQTALATLARLHLLPFRFLYKRTH